jgi:hypothetical protein
VNIFPPAPPTFAILIKDGDLQLGVTDAHPIADARRHLDRIRGAYPDSSLVDYDGGYGQPVASETVTRAVYQHTLRVAEVLTTSGLPLVGWDATPYAPDHLRGAVDADGVEQARAQLARYAEALGTGEITERMSEHGLHLALPEVVWGGVRVEMKAFVPKHQLPIGQEPVEYAEQAKVGA